MEYLEHENKIKDLVWEFENGSINPFKLVEKLKEIINEMEQENN